VTVNEYIEMAKSYSSPKSSVFINGLLGVIIDKLRKEGTLQKKN
jgi:N utilization substance protein B